MNKRRTLFDAGIITLDSAACIKSSGAVRDHSNLFRITREMMKHIVPFERLFDL